MAACPHCNASIEHGARFCGTCGRATVDTESQADVKSPFDQGDPYAAMIGREIAGRYRITKKLGEGGMGAVFRAEQTSLKRACAVKLLRPGLMTNEQALRRFNAEAQAVAKLSHPNTIDIYDFGQDTDGSLFIAMEFVEGKSLRDTMTEDGPMQLGRALHIASQIASSLTDAHANNVVHRDLKPDNVMLSVRGKQRDVVHVLDFGIAKLRDDAAGKPGGGGAAMTQAGDMLGTPQYMAPEQIRGEAIDGRVDIYALGCLLYEMVTGRMPHEASSVLSMLSKALTEDINPPSRRRPDLRITPAVDALIGGALQKEADARPPTMELFGEQIGAVYAHLPPDQRGSANASGGLPIATPSPSMQQPVQQAATGMVLGSTAAVSGPPPGFAPAAPQTGLPMMSPYGTPGVAPSPFGAPVGVPPTTLPPHQVMPRPADGGGNRQMIIMVAVVVVFLIGVFAFVELRKGPNADDPSKWFRPTSIPSSQPSTEPSAEPSAEEERENAEKMREEIMKNVEKSMDEGKQPDNGN